MTSQQILKSVFTTCMCALTILGPWGRGGVKNHSNMVDDHDGGTSTWPWHILIFKLDLMRYTYNGSQFNC